jgi:gliding motility-associated-like protein
MDIDSLGNIYVFGTFYSLLVIDGDTLRTDGFNNGIFIAKFSSSGNLLWAKSFGENAYASYAGDIKVDKHGDVIIFGSFFLPTIFYGQSFPGGGFLAKIDSDGNLIWVHQNDHFGPLTFDKTQQGSRLGIDSKNNIVVFSSGILTSEASYIYLSKYDPSGSVLFDNKIATYYQYLFAGGVVPGIGGIAIDNRDEIVVTGYFMNQITFGSTSLVNHFPRPSVNPDIAQLFLAKFTSNGNLKWVIQGDNSQLSEGFSVATDSTNNIYLTGYVYPGASIGDFATGAQAQNGFLAMVTPHGHVAWLKLFSTNPEPMFNNVLPLDIVKDRNGGLYVSGHFYNAIKYQNFSIQQDKYQQIFVMKITVSGDFLDSFVSSGPFFRRSEICQSLPDGNGNYYSLGTIDTSIDFGSDSISAGTISMLLMKIGPFPPTFDFFIEGPDPVCSNDEITLHCTKVFGATNYEWQLPDGVTSLNGSSTTLSNRITVSASSNYAQNPITVSANVQNTTLHSLPYFIDLKFPLKGPFDITGQSKVCPGYNGINFQATSILNATRYDWLLPVGVTAPLPEEKLTNAHTLSFAKTFAGGTISVTAVGECNSLTDSLQIDIFPSPGKPIISGPTKVCTGAPNYSWSVPNDNNAINNSWNMPAGIDINSGSTWTNINARISSAFVAGYIKVTPKGQCGSGAFSDSLFVVGIELPSAALPLSGPRKLCLGDHNLKYDVAPIANSTQYKWNIPSCFEPNGVVLSNATSIVVNVAKAEQGSITVQGINQCNQTGTPTLLVVQVDQTLPIPNIQKGHCDWELSTDGNVKIQWYKNGVILPDTSKAIHIADSGFYKVSVKNYCGLVESDAVSVYPVSNANDIFFPNVITPNGDGKNDYFEIDESLTNSHLSILNRWGDKIYDTDNYQNNWSGVNQDAGVYYYYLQNACLDSPYKGWIQVMR